MARSLGLSTREDFEDWLNNGGRGLEFGAYFPQKPQEIYADEWQGWPDFLGARRSYDDAKNQLRELGLASVDDWLELATTNPKKLTELRIPIRPHLAYKADFKGYYDWLGLEAPSSESSSGDDKSE